MSKLLLIIISFIGFSVSASVVFAADSFYVEIGNKSSAEAVKNDWYILSEKYKNLLADLKLFPKQVVDESGNSATVIQAGPILKKAQAQKICSVLFAKKIPCFVIDGLGGDAPPTISTTMSKALGAKSLKIAQSEDTTPWVDDSPIVSSATNNEATQVIGQIGSNSGEGVVNKKVDIISKVTEKTEAKVEVAQAIAVPLSNDIDTNPVILSNDDEYNNQKPKNEIKTEVKQGKTEKTIQPSVENIPEAKNLKIDAKELKPADVLADNGGGWLSIEGFENETEANNFWKELSNKKSNLIIDLRSRINRSLVSGGAGGSVKLNVGPFSSANSGKEFCKQAKLINTKIICHFAIDSSSALQEVEQSQNVNKQINNPYEERRQSLLQQNQSKNYSKSSVIESISERLYWVQIAVADSKAEAKRRLAEIKSANSDILSSMSSRITESTAHYTKYKVSIGTISSEDEAEKLCDSLQLRGVDCLVFATK